MNNIEQKIEAILFAVGDPVGLKKLTDIINESEEVIRTALIALKQKYSESSSGIYLIEQEDSFQLATKPETSDIIKRVVKTETHENLTPSALETLSLVVYLAPISKSSLEYIRGVNSSFILRNLLIRGLVSRTIHPQKNNTYLYHPTHDLMRHLGITSQEELPDFAKYQELKANLEQ